MTADQTEYRRQTHLKESDEVVATWQSKKQLASYTIMQPNTDLHDGLQRRYQEYNATSTE